MSAYDYEQHYAGQPNLPGEGRTSPTQDSQAKRILLSSSDSAHRRRSSSTLDSIAPSLMPSNELEEDASMMELRRNSAAPSTSTVPNAVSATGPSPSVIDPSLTAPASTSCVIPPPPEPVESVYEPPTPLPPRTSRRPLPALPDAPRFVPLHGLPPPPAAVSRLKTTESEELTTAEEEKRAYARARGLDELFESRSASTSDDGTEERVPISTTTELPDYPAGGSASLVRGRSMLKRDQHVTTIAEDDEARANADEARQRTNAESERLIELDAADSKVAARRRMEQAEEESRQRRQQTQTEEHAQVRKRQDDSDTFGFDIDEIDGLDDPPPPHDAVPTLMPDDLLPLTDSKATWPFDSAAADSSSHPAPLIPTASLLPPPPTPLAIASADPTSFSRPSLHQAQTAPPALASAPDFFPTTRPQVRRNATIATLPVTHQESLFYPGAIAPLPASSRYASPPSTGSAKTTARGRMVHRTSSFGPAAAFYTSDVGGALNPGFNLSGSQTSATPLSKNATALPSTHPDPPFTFRSSRNDSLATPSLSDGFQSLHARISSSTLRSSESWAPSQTSRSRGRTYSSMMTTSSLPSQASAPAFLPAASLSASTRADFSPSFKHAAASQEPTASPAFYAAVTPGGPLLPFYASPPSTSGGPVSYYTPAFGATLPLPSGTFESAAGPAALSSTLPFDHQRSSSAPQHVQQVMTRHESPVASRAMSVSPAIYDPATGSQAATRRRESSLGIWSRSPSADAAQTLEANAWAGETASDYGSLDGQARGGGGATKWRRLQTIRGLFGRKGPRSVLGDAAEEAGSTS